MVIACPPTLPTTFCDWCWAPTAAPRGQRLNELEAMSPPATSKPRGLAERGASCLAWNLRLFSILQLAAGAGYVTLAIFLQFPPGDPLTL